MKKRPANLSFDDPATAARAASARIDNDARDRPAHALLAIEDYDELSGGSVSPVEALAQTTDFDFEAPRLADLGLRVADLG